MGKDTEAHIGSRSKCRNGREETIRPHQEIHVSIFYITAISLYFLTVELRRLDKMSMKSITCDVISNFAIVFVSSLAACYESTGNQTREDTMLPC